MDDNLLGYLTCDPKYSRTYINAINTLNTGSSISGDCYHNSMIDSDNVNDSIKVKILYNELMSLKTEFSNAERALRGEISYLQAKNRNLEDEITSIKQALYFG